MYHPPNRHRFSCNKWVISFSETVDFPFVDNPFDTQHQFYNEIPAQIPFQYFGYAVTVELFTIKLWIFMK